MNSTPLYRTTVAPQDSKLALGTRLNSAVNSRLDRPLSSPTGELAGGRDTFSRTVSRDAQAGARLFAAPRHVLNHLAGSSAAPRAATATAGPVGHNFGQDTHLTSVQHRPGLLWSVLENASKHTARAAGGVCGFAGTAVGAVGGSVLPAVSHHTAEGCVRGTASASAEAGEGLVGGILKGASLLVSEAVAGVAAAISGLLAGVGALVGGTLGIPHGVAAAFGSSFRRQGAEAVVERAEEARAAGDLDAAAPATLNRLKDELTEAAA